MTQTYQHWNASGRSFHMTRHGFSWQTSRKDRQCKNNSLVNGVEYGCKRVIHKGDDYFRDGDRILCTECAKEEGVPPRQ